MVCFSKITTTGFDLRLAVCFSKITIMEEKEQKKDYLLPVSILTAGIMISGSIIYVVGSKNLEKTSRIEKNQLAELNQNQSDGLEISSRDVILGNPDAPVTFIEYGDYQCPFCARFFTQVEEPLREEYIKTGKVRMVFRNFQFLGPESEAAGEAAECAKDQGKFWAYHDALYTVESKDGAENNGNLNRSLFVKIAGDLGMDTASFISCIDGKKYADQVAKDTSDARSLGVNSTPTSFINGRKIVGALPYSQFKAAIDEALKVK